MESYGLSMRKLPNISKSTNEYVRKTFHNVRCHSEFRCLHYIVQILCKRAQIEFTLILPSAAKYYLKLADL